MKWLPIATTLLIGLTGCVLSPKMAVAQKNLPISEFKPRSNLKTKTTLLEHARFPVIDAHTHFGLRLKGDDAALDAFVETMDQHRIAICVSLDAKLGEESAHQAFVWKKHRDRFLVFAHIDFVGDGDRTDPPTWACNQPGFVRTCCEQLRRAAENGVVGVKFFKQFGLGYRDSRGHLIRIDDRQFDPFWELCGKLKLPIIIHTGDPAAFFLPIDATNERYEELSRHPDWSFGGSEFPSRAELLDARNRVIARHPKTIFIGAHMAGNPEDLGTVGDWLDKYPNLYVEIASRISELGRQPYSSRDFIIRYQDRILFGTDGPWPELRLTYYWRFLESRDENFPYSEKMPPPQGLWNIHGIGLPDAVLKKIYSANFLKLVPAALPVFEAASRKLKTGGR